MTPFVSVCVFHDALHTYICLGSSSSGTHYKLVFAGAEMMLFIVFLSAYFSKDISYHCGVRKASALRNLDCRACGTYCRLCVFSWRSSYSFRFFFAIFPNLGANELARLMSFSDSEDDLDDLGGFVFTAASSQRQQIQAPRPLMPLLPPGIGRMIFVAPRI